MGRVTAVLINKDNDEAGHATPAAKATNLQDVLTAARESNTRLADVIETPTGDPHNPSLCTHKAFTAQELQTW